MFVFCYLCKIKHNILVLFLLLFTILTLFYETRHSILNNTLPYLACCRSFGDFTWSLLRFSCLTKFIMHENLDSQISCPVGLAMEVWIHIFNIMKILRQIKMSKIMFNTMYSQLSLRNKTLQIYMKPSAYLHIEVTES